MIALLYFAATLTAAQAASHVGEQATVCGTVASARYAERSKGKPTFLNFDKPFPHAIFTVVIWDADRKKFDAPEEKYRDRQLCATGKIESYRDAPQIIIHDPKDLTIPTQPAR